MTINYYQIILYILIFILGGAVGSFVNLVVDRLYIKNYWKGRSICDNCAKKLSWYELIPVLSYIFLKGKCKQCKTFFGKYHFWVEIIFGIIFLLTYIFVLENYFLNNIFQKEILTGILFSLFSVFLYIIFGVIFLYDLRHKLVPLGSALTLIIIGLAFQVFKIVNFYSYYTSFSTIFWLDIFSGFLIALPFTLIYLFTKGRGVGMGDILIFFGIGYLAGFIYGLTIFLFSVWIGAIFSIILLLWKGKSYNRKSQIPFAPFIILATILVLFLKIDILNFALFLN